MLRYFFEVEPACPVSNPSDSREVVIVIVDSDPTIRLEVPQTSSISCIACGVVIGFEAIGIGCCQTTKAHMNCIGRSCAAICARGIGRKQSRVVVNSSRRERPRRGQRGKCQGDQRHSNDDRNPSAFHRTPSFLARGSTKVHAGNRGEAGRRGPDTTGACPGQLKTIVPCAAHPGKNTLPDGNSKCLQQLRADAHTVPAAAADANGSLRPSAPSAVCSQGLPGGCAAKEPLLRPNMRRSTGNPRRDRLPFDANGDFE